MKPMAFKTKTVNHAWISFSWTLNHMENCSKQGTILG